MDLQKRGLMPRISATASLRSGASKLSTWLLFIQYACCFGVELTMNNAAALYFRDEFGQSAASAAAIASIFGWMNLFARGAGGFLSDHANQNKGLRGRILVQTGLLVGEGIFVLIFAHTKTLTTSIVVMLFFSVFVQAAEGSTFGLVPYVDHATLGSVTGIVGAGGSVGAVCFGLAFRLLGYDSAFLIMALAVLASSLLFVFLKLDDDVLLLKTNRTHIRTDHDRPADLLSDV